MRVLSYMITRRHKLNKSLSIQKLLSMTANSLSRLACCCSPSTTAGNTTHSGSMNFKFRVVTKSLSSSRWSSDANGCSMLVVLPIWDNTKKTTTSTVKPESVLQITDGCHDHSIMILGNVRSSVGVDSLIISCCEVNHKEKTLSTYIDQNTVLSYVGKYHVTVHRIVPSWHYSSMPRIHTRTYTYSRHIF